MTNAERAREWLLAERPSISGGLTALLDAVEREARRQVLAELNLDACDPLLSATADAGEWFRRPVKDLEAQVAALRQVLAEWGSALKAPGEGEYVWIGGTTGVQTGSVLADTAAAAKAHDERIREHQTEVCVSRVLHMCGTNPTRDSVIAAIRARNGDKT